MHYPLPDTRRQLLVFYADEANAELFAADPVSCCTQSADIPLKLCCQPGGLAVWCLQPAALTAAADVGYHLVALLTCWTVGHWSARISACLGADGAETDSRMGVPRGGSSSSEAGMTSSVTRQWTETGSSVDMDSRVSGHGQRRDRRTVNSGHRPRYRQRRWQLEPQKQTKREI